MTSYNENKDSYLDVEVERVGALLDPGVDVGDHLALHELAALGAKRGVALVVVRLHNAPTVTCHIWKEDTEEREKAQSGA